MQTERQREATDIRSRGEQEARTIRAQADRQATVIVAEANRTADELRGDGEAQANGIFATAFNRDPDFFAFFRSMEAYRQGLKGENTRIVISPDMPFFRYLTQSPIASETGGAPSGSGRGACCRNRLLRRRRRFRHLRRKSLRRRHRMPRRSRHRNRRAAMDDLVAALGLVLVIEGVPLCERAPAGQGDDEARARSAPMDSSGRSDCFCSRPASASSGSPGRDRPGSCLRRRLRHI